MKQKIMLEKDEVKDHMESFRAYLENEGLNETEIERRIAAHYTNSVIRKYSNDEQDIMWNHLMEIIDSPGGVQWLISNMDYMPEFEHRRFKCLKSLGGKKKTFIKETEA